MLVIDHPRHMQILDAGFTIEPIAEWLNEWRRWMLGEIGPDMPMCVSAEHNYSSPQCWDEPEPREPPLREWMGFRVERIVTRLSEPFRTAIRIEICTVRQPTESEGQFYERKRRLANLPAWQYHRVVDDSVKSIEMSLGLRHDSTVTARDHIARNPQEPA